MGDILRVAREEQRLTQAELSFRSDVSQTWLSQVELGHVANPSAARIRKIADALGVDARVFFAAQFDIPYEGSVVEEPSPPDDLIALTRQIATLTARLTRLAEAQRAPESPSQTQAEGS